VTAAVLTRPFAPLPAVDTVLTEAAALIVRHGFHPFGFGGRHRPDNLTCPGYSIEGAIYEALGLLIDNFTLSPAGKDDPRWQIANGAFTAVAAHMGVKVPSRAFGAVCDWSEAQPAGTVGKLAAVRLLGMTAVKVAEATGAGRR
jgi:hypothetical protein